MADDEKVYRSAVDGKYVTEEYAKAHPDTTYAVTREDDEAEDEDQ